jgi:hypothetical protein
MAKSQTSKRDEEHEVTRRALIKWSLAAGAALGVSKAGVFEVLEKTAGRGLAFAAAEMQTCRSVHLFAGNGGFAWFQLLWPHHDIGLPVDFEPGKQHREFYLQIHTECVGAYGLQALP